MENPAHCHHFNLQRLIVIVRINVLHKDLRNLHNVAAQYSPILCGLLSVRGEGSGRGGGVGGKSQDPLLSPAMLLLWF